MTRQWTRRPLASAIGVASMIMVCAHAAPPVVAAPKSQWAQAGTPVLPSVEGLAAGAAGCVVVGLHVLPDGTVAKPRVMTGAYVRVDEERQKTYAAAAIKAATSWKFASSRQEPPESTFEMVTIGFAPSDGATKGVLGVNSQDARLAGHCSIADLAKWGEDNAIPVAQARQMHGDRVVVDDAAAGPRLLWKDSYMVPPAYWREAIQAGADACIIVGVLVQADGTVKNTRVLDARFLKRTPEKMARRFEQESMTALRQWRYAPGPDNLVRMPALIQVPIEFHAPGSQWNGSQCQPLGVADLAARLGEGGQSAPMPPAVDEGMGKDVDPARAAEKEPAP